MKTLTEAEVGYNDCNVKYFQDMILEDRMHTFKNLLIMHDAIDVEVAGNLDRPIIMVTKNSTTLKQILEATSDKSHYVEPLNTTNPIVVSAFDIDKLTWVYLKMEDVISFKVVSK